ncbi:MAG TPA: nuclear transport factor 2 family protein [Solirubrobacteraceae bacterium]|nr:nuclear transport factor 2 family protein [Solirubrobacteraceae bacterium]
MAEEDFPAVRAAYDAFDRHDVDGLLGLLAHNVAWHAPDTLPWGGTRHGRDGVAAYFDVLDEYVENGWGDPDEYLDAGERVVVLGRLRGRARATGDEFEARFAHVWDFQDGVAITFDSIVDSAVVLAALGPAAEA